MSTHRLATLTLLGLPLLAPFASRADATPVQAAPPAAADVERPRQTPAPARTPTSTPTPSQTPTSTSRSTQAPAKPAASGTAKAVTATTGATAATAAASTSSPSSKPRAVVAVAPRHPLDPLTASEIATAVRLVRARPELQGELLFPTIALHEPPKEEVRAFQPATAGATSTDGAARAAGAAGVTFRREAYVEVLSRGARQTFEAIVDLRARTVLSVTPRPGVQPAILSEEIDRVAPLVRADPAFQEAMRKRGLTKMEDIQIDPWAPGLLDPKREPRGTRWVRALAYLKGAQDNGYARPIEGVVALINLDEMKVDRIVDLGVRPVPPEKADLNERAIAQQFGPLRTAPKPLLVQQPLGPSFTVSGQEVRWQKWRFRFAVEPREGLVLYTVGYEDGGRVRPILYRAALSEMLVPYGDPASNWSFRNAFDEGEYGLGRLTGSLEVGTDAPRHARLFDAVFADDHGKPMTVPRAVALYERDGGLLWKHFEYFSDSNDARRGRELVLFSLVTVGNYDYGFNWIFRQDGSLELQAVLTGIMLPKGVHTTRVEPHVAPTASAGAHSDTNGEREGHFWHLVAPNVAAVHHQHFFNFRLDFDVDGATNAVREINTRALPPGPDNPTLNAFVMEETPLRTEQEAQRDLSLASARRWLIVNPSSRNALGQPAAFLLSPGDNAVPYLHPDSPIRRRAGFVNHHFWATAFAPTERHAAGVYPNQSDPDAADGLPTWTKANRPLEGADVVAWYTFGITHVPRPEEWPVMSATHAGFKLLPAGFFTRNPSLDVPKR